MIIQFDDSKTGRIKVSALMPDGRVKTQSVAIEEKPNVISKADHKNRYNHEPNSK